MLTVPIEIRQRAKFLQSYWLDCILFHTNELRKSLQDLTSIICNHRPTFQYNLTICKNNIQRMQSQRKCAEQRSLTKIRISNISSFMRMNVVFIFSKQSIIVIFIAIWNIITTLRVSNNHSYRHFYHIQKNKKLFT